MFLQRKGQVIMTIELLDTEEAQSEDPVEVQVRTMAPCSVTCERYGGWGGHRHKHKPHALHGGLRGWSCRQPLRSLECDPVWEGQVALP